MKFQFKHHIIDTDLTGQSYGQTALADVDGDGRLEFSRMLARCRMRITFRLNMEIDADCPIFLYNILILLGGYFSC